VGEGEDEPYKSAYTLIHDWAREVRGVVWLDLSAHNGCAFGGAADRIGRVSRTLAGIMDSSSLTANERSLKDSGAEA
jgi:hypothetical protein